MYIYSANGISIGEITHNEKKETIVRAFRHAIIDALPNETDVNGHIIIHDLVNIVNIPQDCPTYAERLNFAIFHIQSVYALANQLGRITAELKECRTNYFKAAGYAREMAEKAVKAEREMDRIISG